MKGDADNFHLEFPENCDPQDRALLMAAVLFLDFRFFEEKREPQRNWLTELYLYWDKSNFGEVL